MLKNLIRIICLLSIILILSNNKVQEIKYEHLVYQKIKEDKDNKLNYISIDNYKLLIESGVEKDILNRNHVYLMKNSNIDNIFLAGHNNKLVFNRLYSINTGDIIYVNYKKNKIKYYVKEKKYINVDDYSIFNNKNNLTLITCCNTNQKRYIVICKKC